MTLDLQACLPAAMRGPSTTITRIAAGLSGAGVYRVDAAGQAFVLKVSRADEPLADWLRSMAIREQAALAGLAPRLVHVDEGHRAALSAFVADLSFPALYFDPRTRPAALALLGGMLRRLHDLPLAPDARETGALPFLAGLWAGPLGTFALPAFVRPAVERMLAQVPPPAGRPPVLSHNDVNPTNLVYDGERLLLLDWDTAGRNDGFYDLAAIAVFLRMDDEACKVLLAAHDGAAVADLPAGFSYQRRLAATLCGAMFLDLARQQGHGGAGGAETLDTTAALGEFYQRLRAGALSVASAEGQWAFGLALIKESLSR